MNCEITNDDFAVSFPRDKQDWALTAISDALWFHYDDLRTHKLEGKFKLSPESKELFGRCMLFLSSDLEYEWPKIRLISLSAGLLRVLGLGKIVDKRCAQFEKAGDYDVWPFLRREDYLKLKSPQTAEGGSSTAELSVTDES